MPRCVYLFCADRTEILDETLVAVSPGVDFIMTPDDPIPVPLPTFQIAFAIELGPRERIGIIELIVLDDAGKELARHENLRDVENSGDARALLRRQVTVDGWALPAVGGYTVQLAADTELVAETRFALRPPADFTPAAAAAHLAEAKSVRRGHLWIPHVPNEVFRRHFLQTVIAELRFPALIEIESKMLRRLEERLRKRYPLHSSSQMLIDSGSGAAELEVAHTYRTRNGRSAATVRRSALALEVTRYTTYADFIQELEHLMGVVVPLIDTDFFTRVGLRYVNTIPIVDNVLVGWVRGDLIRPIVTRVLGPVGKYFQEVHGAAVGRGGYVLRHGIPAPETPPNYVLDFDFFEGGDAGVELAEVRPLLDRFHEQVYDFFRWAIGEKTLVAMRSGDQKPQSPAIPATTTPA